tara:strand:+ start:6777 stop:7241 length:465 start_codon:yes stop_codon:yes gene_type:complete
MSNSDVPNQEPQRNDWNQEDLGKRHNNQGDKGLGFYGKIPLDSEKFDYATEYSIGVLPEELDLTSKDLKVIRKHFEWDEGASTIEIPSFVPGLSSKEFTLLKDQASNNMDEEEIPDSIMEKIKKHAKNRLIKGKSPFWEEGEKQHSPPVDQASK